MCGSLYGTEDEVRIFVAVGHLQIDGDKQTTNLQWILRLTVFSIALLVISFSFLIFILLFPGDQAGLGYNLGLLEVRTISSYQVYSLRSLLPDMRHSRLVEYRKMSKVGLERRTAPQRQGWGCLYRESSSIYVKS